MSAARLVDDPEYGEEYALTVTESGCEVRTDAGPVGSPMFGCDYVRVVAPDGREIGYWHSDEWRDDPLVVMGAILGAASGVVVEPID